MEMSRVNRPPVGAAPAVLRLAYSSGRKALGTVRPVRQKSNAQPDHAAAWLSSMMNDMAELHALAPAHVLAIERMVKRLIVNARERRSAQGDPTND